LIRAEQNRHTKPKGSASMNWKKHWPVVRKVGGILLAVALVAALVVLLLIYGQVYPR
jgi:cytochrome c-type biogenesis protein CcmH/NrfG